MPEEMFKELARSVLEDTKDLLGTPGNPHEMKLFCTVFNALYHSREFPIIEDIL